MSTVQGGQGNIVTNGLVLWLDAANPRSYDYPYIGTTWRDLSGNNNTGTLINGPTYNSLNGGSIVFDGVNDYSTTNSNLPFGLNPFCIDLWFKTNGVQSTNSTLICIANVASTSNWQLSFTSDVMRFFNSAGTWIQTSYTANGLWTNVSVVRESTNSNGFKIYINGIQNVQSILTNDFTDTNGWRIGMNRGSNAWFNGNISITKIYNRALSQQEVQQNFNATRGRFGI